MSSTSLHPATWQPEPATVPPTGGVSTPLSGDELTLLSHYRALPPHERRLIGGIVAALAPERENRP